MSGRPPAPTRQTPERKPAKPPSCPVISACKTGSAKRVTAVTPLFPYSRQPDLPYRKAGAPLSKAVADVPGDKYTFESVPPTPGPGTAKSLSLINGGDLGRALGHRSHSSSVTSAGAFTKHDYDTLDPYTLNTFESKPGYKRWVAQAGTLIADLLICAGADQYVYCPPPLSPLLRGIDRPCTAPRLAPCVRRADRESSVWSH